MRIDEIADLSHRCTGCMACVDACPAGCIEQILSEEGFLYTKIREELCIQCGKCAAVCPLETKQSQKAEQKLYAAYSTLQGGPNRGSSGGIFELLALHFLREGWYVCGAAFDENLKLRHRIIHSEKELSPLLKSKYLQSDMKGIYLKIRDLLKQGENVFFCGTPCQVSAVLNSVPQKYREHLRTADIICHGVPSQSLFDQYLQSVEKSKSSRVRAFSFRVKDNKYRHSHGFRYLLDSEKGSSKVDGVYTQSSFYYAFKEYLIFRKSCYRCQYATQARCSDMTLADFWGIEKYDFPGNTDEGVSMVITNSEEGREMLSAVWDSLVIKEFPLQYGIDSNFCFTHSTKEPPKRDAIFESLRENGYDAAAAEYFSGGNSLKYRVYWCIPAKIRNILRKLRG